MRKSVREFILENYLYGAAPEELDDAASFLEEGIIDSTGVMELILFLEEEFDVKVEDTEMVPENLDSVDCICRFLESKGVASEEESAFCRPEECVTCWSTTS